MVCQLLHIAGGVRSAGAVTLSRDLTWQSQVYNVALHNTIHAVVLSRKQAKQPLAWKTQCAFSASLTKAGQPA